MKSQKVLTYLKRKLGLSLAISAEFVQTLKIKIEMIK